MTNEYADETMSKVSFDPLASSDPSLPSVNVTREPVNFGRDNKCMKRGALLPEDPPAVDPTEFSSGADLRSSFLFQSSCFLSDGDCTSSGSSLDSSGKSPKPLKSFKKKNVQFNDDLSVCEEGKDDSSSALHGAFRIVVPAILTPSSSSSLPQPPPPPLLLGSVPLDDTTNGDVFTYHQSRAGVSTLTDDDAFYTWQKTRKHRYICLTLVSLFFICCLSVIVTCASGNCNPSRQNQENLQANAPSQVPQDDADMLPTSLRPTISPTIHYNAFESIDELYDAVDSFMENPNNPELLEKYGRIKYWNIAMVSNLAELFSAKRNSLSVNFNEDISRWNTSMVTNMTRLFEGARSFDQNLSLWETCNVRGMRETFSGATQFQGMGLAHWNVSNVDDTTGMFRSAYAFNEDISNWEVELVTSLAEMFLEALSFNQSLKAWNTKSATNMSSMFANAPLFSGDLSSFDTSKVIDMSSMFRQATSFMSDLSTWDTQHVTSMAGMFSEALSFHSDLSQWNVSSVTNMSEMFSMSSFQGNVQSWLVDNVRDFSRMFVGAKSFSQDLCIWRERLTTASAENLNMRGMFLVSGCVNMTAPDPDDLFNSSFCHTCMDSPLASPLPSTSQPTIAEFANETEKKSSLLPIESTESLYAAIDKYLSNKSGYLYLSVVTAHGYPIGSWDVSQITNFSNAFSAERNPGTKFFNEDLSGWNTSAATTLEAAFMGAETFNGNISTWDTGRVTSMSMLFKNAYRFQGNLSEWDTSSLENLNSAFESAELFDGDLSRWNTSIVLDLENTFRNAFSFTGTGLSAWNIERVTSFKRTFDSALSFRGNLSNWSTKMVSSMSGTFRNSFDWNHDISRWEVSNVKSFDQMFRGARSFNRDLSGWLVSNSTDFTLMFAGAKSFNQNLCQWGSQLSPFFDSLTIKDIFTASACLDTNDPDEFNLAYGPFCQTCAADEG